MENLSFMIMFACIIFPSIIANDSINVLQSMSDGETLVSKGEIYELGFFSPGRSQKRYLGIWFKNIPIQTVVWVANRENPINDSSGILTLNSTGNLVLTQNGSLVWYTNPHQQALNPVVELLDSGNLVVRNEAETDPKTFLWQSFEHPSDTFLAGMKLGWDLKTYQERKLTSWKSPDDPSPGDVSRVLKLYNYPEFYIMRGEQKLFRFGPWNGIYFSGIPDLTHTIYGLSFVSSKDQNFVRNIDEIYFTYSIPDNSIIVRSVVNQTGIIYRYSWVEANKTWINRTLPREFCDNYGFCGPYGNCLSDESESQACQCLRGFSPKSQEAWNSSNWSRGCVRNTPLSCKDKLKDGFVKFEGLKVPDTTHTLLDESIGLKECKDKCLNNCSCMAYTNSDIRDGGSGCVIWLGDLIDLKQQAVGQDLYVRMPASELVGSNPPEPVYRHKRNTPKIVASTVVAVCGVLLLSSYFIYSIRRKYAEKNKSQKDDINLPTFDFSSISRATNHFSQNNKLGQGGFGVVYKGILPNGQEIAVKRLSKTSIQGLDEFKNEVMLIVKLQHRNLVKLFGCSIQQDEKLLIYEFMPNRSLDYIIFDSTRRALLDWTKRFDIINGIARGLLYLHHDSRLKIIHRDLKTSNVLLDSNMNPKISDFGMARIFALDQDEADTDKVVGTYGYIPPEYAAHGSFSTKSDVFSFGVIVLEIISGRKNRRFYDSQQSLNLLGHAWRLWIENRPMELVDDLVDDLAGQFEIIRYIHIGLLCVQQRPQDRPEMSSVILMLNGEKLLPEPSQPGFYTGKDYSNTTASSSRNIDSSYTLNEISDTMLEGR